MLELRPAQVGDGDEAVEVAEGPGGGELYLGPAPGGLQAKRGGEEGFDLMARGVRGGVQDRGVVPPITMSV